MEPGKNFVVDDTLSVSASHSSKLAALSESDFRKHEQKNVREGISIFFSFFLARSCQVPKLSSEPEEANWDLAVSLVISLR